MAVIYDALLTRRQTVYHKAIYMNNIIIIILFRKIVTCTFWNFEDVRRLCFFLAPFPCYLEENKFLSFFFSTSIQKH